METKFKGTQGSWKLANNEYGYFTSVRNLDDSRKICTSRVNNQIESNANMLLISKAPEMFEMLESVLELQKENYGSGMNTHLALSSKAKQIEQLLKEATEL